MILDLSKRGMFQLNSSLIDHQTDKNALCRFQQCSGPVDMLTAGGCSQKGLFRYLSKRVFHSQEYKKYLSYEADFFSKKCLKISIDFRNAMKFWEKNLDFLHNCI